MKKIRFKLSGRFAQLIGRKYLDEVRDFFSFTVASARYTPQFKRWLQEKALGIPEEDRQGWNGKKYLMDSDGILSVGLLLAEKENLIKEGFDIFLEDWEERPTVALMKGFSTKEEKYLYQNNAVENMISSIGDFGGGLVLAATGAGKTKIAAQFFSHIKGECLFVVDQVPLLYQSQKEIQEWLSKEGYDLKVGVVGNSKFEPERVTVATIQTLSKHRNSPKFRAWTDKIKIVIIDEIHVQMSRRNFDVVENINPQAVIGLTATMQLKQKPVRFRCYAICGPQIYDFPITKGVEQGVLTQGAVVQLPVAHNSSPRKIRKYVNDKPVLDDDYTHEVVRNANLLHSIDAIARECLRQDLCVAILVDRIKHVKRVAKILKDKDPKLFYGAVDVDTRKKQIKTFESGKDNLFVANRVFVKGINVKRIDVILDAAQMSSKNDCIQKFGRAVRLHSEKAGIWYFDLFTQGKMEKAAKRRYGAFKKHKIPIVRLDNISSVKTAIQTVDNLLKDALKKNKERTAQKSLF